MSKVAATGEDPPMSDFGAAREEQMVCALFISMILVFDKIVAGGVSNPASNRKNTDVRAF
jgi:hypothetical protein